MQHEKKCGTCRWHFDLYGTNESEGVANCLALRWPEVAAVLSTKDATCLLPEQYMPKGEGFPVPKGDSNDQV